MSKEYRLLVRFTEKQKKFLDEEAKNTGNSVTSIIRCALNEYFMKKEGGW